MFTIWAHVLALGLGWGGYWLLNGFGVDVTGFVSGLLDWGSVGWVGTALIAFLIVTAVGAAGLAVAYFTEYWNFELARVRGPDGTLLRTRQGLFTTREVTRDDNRIRGVQISEPVLWRWTGVSETSVITTGLSMRSMAQPTAILPRGPVTVARHIAAEVLGCDEDPLHTTLAKHPAQALRRRLWWATAVPPASAWSWSGWRRPTSCRTPRSGQLPRSGRARSALRSSPTAHSATRSSGRTWPRGPAWSAAPRPSCNARP